MGRPGLLQLRFRRADSLCESLRVAGRALHRHAFAVVGVHADALRDSHGTLLLAIAAEKRRAGRLFAEPHRTRTAHGARHAQAAGLLHRGSRQVASRIGGPREDRLLAAAAARADRSSASTRTSAFRRRWISNLICISRTTAWWSSPPRPLRAPRSRRAASSGGRGRSRRTLNFPRFCRRSRRRPSRSFGSARGIRSSRSFCISRFRRRTLPGCRCSPL